MEPSFLPVAVRAFTKRTSTEPDNDDPAAPPEEAMRPTYLVAIDTETTTDASQRLLFGAWRYARVDWDGDVPALVVLDEGLFYEDDLPDWNPSGYALLRSYAAERFSDSDRTDPEAAWQLRLQRRAEFVEDVIWRAAYERKAHLAFFNAGFDISRIALRAAPSRLTRPKGKRRPDRRFVGGFSFFVFPDGEWRPWFKVKHLDSKRALKRFGGPKRIDPENLDDTEEEDERAFGGHILDCRTLAFALTNASHSLESACDTFGVPYIKRDVEHGVITTEYIDYGREDVEATLDLARALLAEYAQHPIQVQPTRAYSPASIAKGYLRAMGITRPSSRLGSTPEDLSWDQIQGYAMTSYYGGRTEVKIRRTSVPVAVLDFTSQYPTVCRLIDAWSYLTADRIDACDQDPEETGTLVDGLDPHALFKPEIWPRLFGICQIEPNGDMLPVRARYDERGQYGIGVNPYTFDAERLDSPFPWYALPDVVAAKLLGGNTPKIKRTLMFRPEGRLDGLRPTVLRGMVPIDPVDDDFFQLVIEERERRFRDTSLPEVERNRLRDFLKVLANSSGYGIYAEVNRTELSKSAREEVEVFGLSTFSERVRAPEAPGEFFFAPLASVITASGRLLLAMLEQEVRDRGGMYAACDTDSCFVVATKDGLPDPANDSSMPVLSWAEVHKIQGRFNLLNPYERGFVPELLKAEQASLEQELRCYAISAKRYALFHNDVGGTEVIVTGDLREDDESADAWDIAKPSQHGLGHLLNPTDPGSGSRDWIDEGWRWLMALDLGSTAVREPAWLDRPAVAQVSISTPNWWRLFDQWNQGSDYADAVKPFGFMLVAYADPLRTSFEVGRLIHTYERDPRRWLETDWADLYEPERRVLIDVRRPADPLTDPNVVYVKTYRDVLLGYLGHPEAKSLSGEGDVCRRDTRGVLTRRPVEAAMVTHIGKESNRLEERLAGLVANEDDFLLSLGGDSSWERLVIPAARLLGFRKIADRSGIPDSTLADLFSFRTKPQKRHERALTRAVHSLAGDWLRPRALTAPADVSARLATFVAEFERWKYSTADDYLWALNMLRGRPGLVSRVARGAGVSRRRIWKLQDPALQEAVVNQIKYVSSLDNPQT